MPYLPAQPTAPLSPQSPLTYLKTRLRRSIVPVELFDDETLLAYMNEAYQRACEKARCLPAIASIVVTEGVQEYALPADFSEALLVYRDGLELEFLPQRLALRADVWGYYVYDGILGLAPAPTGDSTVWFIYARSPAPLTTYVDAFDPAFTPEFYDALLHYARWKRYSVDGGTDKMGQASWERDRWRLAILRLRESSRRIDAAARSRFVHVTETLGVSRHRLANDVDAR